jgi:polysaccharide biosynthesis/export protein
MAHRILRTPPVFRGRQAVRAALARITNGRCAARLGGMPALLAMCILALASGCHPIDFYATSLQGSTPLELEPARELSMVSLPPYCIQPPDVLYIEIVTLVPRAPYRIDPQDILRIDVLGTLPKSPIHGRNRVDSDGTMDLGIPYGKVHVAGLTVEEAEAETLRSLQLILKNPMVSVSLFQSAAAQQLSKTYRVGPDGRINFGRFGFVNVAGKTVGEAKKAIEEHLAQYFDSPQVGLDVRDFNSMSYYVIVPRDRNGYSELEEERMMNAQDIEYSRATYYRDGMRAAAGPWTEARSPWGESLRVSRAPLGDWSEARFAITGNETVLDVISQLGPKEQRRMSSKVIWIARPAPDGNGPEQILPVNWTAIVRDGRTDTNYQIMPGDRIYVADDSLVAMNSAVRAFVDPISKLLGLSNLGTTATMTAETLGRSYNKLRIRAR